MPAEITITVTCRTQYILTSIGFVLFLFGLLLFIRSDNIFLQVFGALMLVGGGGALWAANKHLIPKLKAMKGKSKS